LQSGERCTKLRHKWPAATPCNLVDMAARKPLESRHELYISRRDLAVASGDGLSSVLHELKMTERIAWQDTAIGGRSSGEAHTALPGGPLSKKGSAEVTGERTERRAG
jgi:hypothetical protein